MATDHQHLDIDGGDSWLIFGERTELYFAIGSGFSWLLGLVAPLLSLSPRAAILSFLIGMFLGGVFTVREAWEAIVKGKFEIDFLMLVAAAGAAALGKFSEGALLLFLFSLGHALEHYAMGRARKSIAALADLSAPHALMLIDGEMVEVEVEDLKVGDLIITRPNSKIAADGVVVKGESAVNQAPITGESIPVEKYPITKRFEGRDFGNLPSEHQVFAGTINGGQSLEVRVMRLHTDSTLSRLVELVQEAEAQKSPTQLFTDRFERVFVPIVLVMVGLLLFAYLVIDETFEDSFYRAMSVLIAASPCALAISTPSAVLSGVARAAKQGVLIKGGRPLESLSNIRAIAFDKTGTLTRGRPQLTGVVPFEVGEEELLETAIAVEELSDHPLAAAIVKGGYERLGHHEVAEAEELTALTARGVSAQLEGQTVHLGNRRLFEELTGAPIPAKIDTAMTELERQGNTAMIVHRENQYLGVIAAMDVERPEAAATLAHLGQLGVRRMVMLTGDNQQVAEAIAQQIGITDPLGNLLPEDKVQAIRRLQEEEGGVAMVGDGVNDAPAMATSSVGIAMGAAGSDVALETADIALMADKLDNLPFAIALSKKTKQIIRQNLWISLGMVAILVPLTILGIARIGPAVVAHEGSTLLVVLNALRLLGFKERK